MGKAQRVKGHSFEREVARLLRDLDPSARRNVEEPQVAGCDIKTKLPLAIQCKCLKNWSVLPHSILAQAAGGADSKEQIPVGIVRIDRKKPDLAILALADFLEILEALGPLLDEPLS